MTDKFINTTYSVSLYPKITRPSRITPHSSTLIDNIFTNNIENNTVSGLLIVDISDHLPVFTAYDGDFKVNHPGERPTCRRLRTDENMNAFKNDLLAQNWDVVYKENDVDSETFLRIFTSLYDKKLSSQTI